jgi:hypothetical protein
MDQEVRVGSTLQREVISITNSCMKVEKHNSFASEKWSHGPIDVHSSPPELPKPSDATPGCVLETM